MVLLTELSQEKVPMLLESHPLYQTKTFVFLSFQGSQPSANSQMKIINIPQVNCRAVGPGPGVQGLNSCRKIPTSAEGACAEAFPCAFPKQLARCSAQRRYQLAPFCILNGEYYKMRWWLKLKSIIKVNNRNK